MDKSSKKPFRLAHISDVHLSISPQVKLRHFASKRALGYMNWHRNRRGAMTTASLDRLVADMMMQEPDHIVVTGDLTNLALLSEFNNAARWLQSLGGPEMVTVIPGNHDAYVRGASQYYLDLWAPWMGVGAQSGAEHATFPFLKRVDEVALIGVSSAVPSPPFLATGRIGAQQASDMKKLLRVAKNEELFRVILVHHPPSADLKGNTWRRLVDAARFRQVVTAEGADLVLHGHEHVRSASTIEGPTGPVPVIGVPPGGSGPDQGHKSGGYALHDIDLSDTYPHLTTTHRGYRPDQSLGDTAHFEMTIR